MFKRNICKNLKFSSNIQHKLVKSASDFLDKTNEKVIAIEHHNCLSFVPISMVNLMKTFVAFTPTVTIGINDAITAIEQCDDVSIEVKQESSDEDDDLEEIECVKTRPKKMKRKKKSHGKRHTSKSNSGRSVGKKNVMSRKRETSPKTKEGQSSLNCVRCNLEFPSTYAFRYHILSSHVLVGRKNIAGMCKKINRERISSMGCQTETAWACQVSRCCNISDSWQTFRNHFITFHFASRLSIEIIKSINKI